MRTAFYLPSSIKFSRFGAVFVLALAIGGCKTMDMGDVTGSLGTQSSALPQSPEARRAFAETWGRRFEANPADKTAALTYAHALRATAQYNQAAAVLQTAVIKHAGDKDMIGAYGKALVDAGRLQEALPVLANAHTPERPNWSILSTEGSVADQLGDHGQAQRLYQQALKIVPGEPSVLSNLGLSYALAKDLPQAESTMRIAVDNPRADARVRQNLALVLALEGKFGEAETLSQKDLTPQQASANIAAIRQMIAQSNTWRDIQKLNAGKKAASRKPG